MRYPRRCCAGSGSCRGRASAPGPDVIHGARGDREQGAASNSTPAHEGHISEARFLAFGCPHLLAAASWLTERMVGLNRAQLAAWDWQEAAQALDIPPRKFWRLLTLQDAARVAAELAGATGSTV